MADVFLGWFGTSWNEVWTSIKDFFVGIWDSICSAFQSVADFFTNIWNAIVAFFTNDNSHTVNQTSNSPKSLSRLEIYRQTKNAVEM